MHAIVIGAGLAGVTAAWELKQSGHSVAVVDRGGEAASETSYANAGLVATGHAMPWASPKVPGILLKSLFSASQAYRLTPRLDWQMLRWGLRFLRQCTRGRNAENTAEAYRLCRYAQSRLHAVTEQAGLEYHAQRRGLLYMYRSQAALDEGLAAMRVVRELGHEVQVLDAAGINQIDPAYGQADGRLAGAAYCPSDESGDARLFTRALADACRRAGVELEYGCTVNRIVMDGDRVARLDTSAGQRDADIYVLASGVEAPLLTRPAGIDLPIYPVKGYSVTFPIGEGHRPPTVGGLDEGSLIAFSRLGDRLRITSTAQIAGYDTSHQAADFAPMITAFSTLMPEAADYERPEYWSCLRPMTPRGVPIVGPSRCANLYLNTGHGNLGWTMACGTARLLADIIDSRDTEIPAGPMASH